MQVAVLGQGSTSSVLVKHQGIRILLDCSASPVIENQQQDPGIYLALPHFGQVLQAGDIDAVLVTSPYGLLGLPHLQQCLEQSGRALPLHVYCTEPCYHNFQQLATELLQVQHLLQQQQQQLFQQPTAHRWGQQTATHALQQQQLQQQQQQQQQQPSHQLLFQQQLQQHVQQLYQQQQQQQQQQHWQAAPAAHGVTFVPNAHPPNIPLASATAAAAAAGAGGNPAAHLQHTASSSLGHMVPSFMTPHQAAASRPRPAPAPPSTPHPSTIETPPAAAEAEAAAAQSKQRQQQQPQASAAVVVPMFTQQQLQVVLDSLQLVRFGQRLLLPGCSGLTAQARPAGCSFDCCMWLLTTGRQRVAYLSPASLYPNPSAPLHASSLQGVDALLLGPGSLCPDLPLPLLNPTQQLLQLAAQTAAAAVLGDGGRVLVPVVTCGALLELLEQISVALASSGPRGAAVPLFLLSPAGPDCLATASSCCEYLEASRQQAVLEAGQPPFMHDELIQSGRLRVLAGNSNPGCVQQQQQQGGSVVATSKDAAAGLSSGGGADDAGALLRSLEAAAWEVLEAGPCVAFVPLWSLLAGAGAMLARACSGNPQDALLLTEQGPLTASWLEQCSRDSSSSRICNGYGCNLASSWLQHNSRWRVLYTPVGSTAGAALPAISRAGEGSCDPASVGHVVGGCLMAPQLLQLLQEQQVRRLLLGTRDRQLLDLCMQQQGASMTHCSLVDLPGASTCAVTSSSSSTSSSPAFVHVDLPDPLIEISLSRDLVKQLMLTPLVKHDPAAAAADSSAEHLSASTTSSAAAAAAAAAVTAPAAVGGPAGAAGGAAGAAEPVAVSVARVQGLLTLQSGCYSLLPLPTFTKPDAIAATVEMQQQPSAKLVWGEVHLASLLADLQAAGFSEVSAVTSAGDGSSTMGGSSMPPCEPVTLVKVADDAEIRLGPNSTEIQCDSWLLRKQLLDIVAAHLNLV